MILRLGIFFGAFLLLASLQRFYPMTKDRESMSRFGQNFAHVLLSQAVVFTVFFSLGWTFFEISEGYKLGLFYHINLPAWSKWLITFIVFDLALYVQHRFSHKWAWFWHFHKVHHSDPMITTSTAVRFHFVEILISAFWKGLFIVLLGAPIAAYFWFEVFLNTCALFNHSNFKIPESIERKVSLFLITPRLHRIHHSEKIKESNTNFSFSICLWDRLFGSFLEGVEVEKVGVKGVHWTSFWEQVRIKDSSP